MLKPTLTLALTLLASSINPASSSPLLALRDVVSAATIIQDVKNIDHGVNDLRAGNAAYQGGILEQTPLLAAFTEIHFANRKGFVDAELRATDFSESDSQAIVTTVVDTVGVSIPAAVDETIAKKNLYEASGTGPALVALLKVLLNDHDTFSAAVEKHLMGAGPRAEGTAVVDEIHDAIVRGIGAFSS